MNSVLKPPSCAKAPRVAVVTVEALVYQYVGTHKVSFNTRQ
jgi:hypothetical protein